MAELLFDERTALVVVDLQNDFAHPKGSLFVAGADALADPINQLAARARRQGGMVVYTQEWLEPQGEPRPTRCVRGTWGAELVDELVVDGPVVKKGAGGEDGYSGFSARDPESGAEKPTALDRILRERGIERLVLVGVAEEVGVKQTALDGRRLGYDVRVIERATRPFDEAGGQRALEELLAAGVEIA
jgi:nicotinamidase/pyrazinamidase